MEDSRADAWQECLEEILGEPKVKRNNKGTECDRLWKVDYKDIAITIHIYNNPKNKTGSKLMLQGRPQSLVCTYVFEELPKIYELVVKKEPKMLNANMKSNKNPSKPVVKCEECKYKSSLIQMKMHMKTVHGTRHKAALKRLPNFTPMLKPAKKLKETTSPKT